MRNKIRVANVEEIVPVAEIAPVRRFGRSKTEVGKSVEPQASSASSDQTAETSPDKEKTLEESDLSSLNSSLQNPQNNDYIKACGWPAELLAQAGTASLNDVACGISRIYF